MNGVWYVICVFDLLSDGHDVTRKSARVVVGPGKCHVVRVIGFKVLCGRESDSGEREYRRVVCVWKK